MRRRTRIALLGALSLVVVLAFPALTGDWSLLRPALWGWVIGYMLALATSPPSRGPPRGAIIARGLATAIGSVRSRNRGGRTA